jgi:hypothetical protein
MSPATLPRVSGMAFNYLLWHCLQDRTSFSEEARGVTIARQSDETILFFAPDGEAVRHQTRTYFNVSQFCDVIIFYQKTNRQVLLFVELKGGDIEHAVTQLRAAVGAVYEMSPRRAQSCKLVAIIVSTSSGPQLIKKAQAEFATRWKATLVQRTQQKGNLELRPFVT